MPTFRRWFSTLATPPLTGEVGRKLLDFYGLIGDIISALVIEASKVSNLYSETFPMDALRHVGTERAIPRYPGETNFSYLSRLRGAWQAYEWLGTPQSIELQLNYAGYDHVAVPDTSNWDWDGNTADWARFWVVLLGHPFVVWTYGESHTWDGGQTWDSTATEADFAFLRAVVHKWKPAHVRCQSIIIVFDEAGWEANQPDGTWGDPTARFADAVYIPG